MRRTPYSTAAAASVSLQCTTWSWRAHPCRPHAQWRALPVLDAPVRPNARTQVGTLHAHVLEPELMLDQSLDTKCAHVAALPQLLEYPAAGSTAA